MAHATHSLHIMRASSSMQLFCLQFIPSKVLMILCAKDCGNKILFWKLPWGMIKSEKRYQECIIERGRIRDRSSCGVMRVSTSNERSLHCWLVGWVNLPSLLGFKMIRHKQWKEPFHWPLPNPLDSVEGNVAVPDMRIDPLKNETVLPICYKYH